ncbi:hypothetical protein C0J52_09763 [Blattella germanica]|nr:hypothetical protein C0J52_09763 [Blattella germanica]
MLTPVLFLVTFILILLQMMRKPKNFPPGPVRWPLLGNIFHIKLTSLCFYEVIEKFAQKHGEVMGFYIARTPVVVISGVDAIREALIKPELQARPEHEVHKFEKRRLGLVITDGEFWKEQRGFVLRHLKDLGMGKSVMEKAIHDEIADMIEEVKRYACSDWSKPIPVHEMVAASGANIIYNMLAGQRFKRSDPKFQDIMDAIQNYTTTVPVFGGLASSMPILLRLFPSITDYPDILKRRTRIYSFLKDARVIINLYGMHNERKYWNDPENFRPDRFLDDHGNLKREDGLIPYGLGMTASY